MSLQLQYPYTSQAPRRRHPWGFNPWPALQNRVIRSGFYGLDGSWDRYINLKIRKADDLDQEYQDPIYTGWVMIALRHWIRRAVNAIKRRRLYDTQIGNPKPAYGIKYPD